MGYAKRKANSKCKVNPINFDKIKQQYLINIYAAVEMEDIPPSLVINWDHTATKIVPSSQWTMEKGHEESGNSSKKADNSYICLRTVRLPWTTSYVRADQDTW